MKLISIRFYEELNDFLNRNKRKVRFTHNFTGKPTVKDIIESLGVPHTEVDLILVNGVSVGFDHIVKNGNDISVYPEFESINIAKIQRLRPKPLRRPKFVLDVHLGALARYMRMLSFDTKYQNNLTDKEIIQISVQEKRAILTRDVGILKHSKVVRGYYLRNTTPLKQIKEIVNRFDLKNEKKEFTRCLECNSILKRIDKKIIEEKLPLKVKEEQKEFYICKSCRKIYWHGTHVEKMKLLIETIFKK